MSDINTLQVETNIFFLETIRFLNENDFPLNPRRLEILDDLVTRWFQAESELTDKTDILKESNEG